MADRGRGSMRQKDKKRPALPRNPSELSKKLNEMSVRDRPRNQENHAPLDEAFNSYMCLIDAVIVCDIDGAVLFMNPAAETMFGYSRVEMSMQNVRNLMPSPYRENHDNYMRQYSQGGVPKLLGITRSLHGQTKTGRRFPMDISLGKFIVSGSQRKLFVATIRERKDSSTEKPPAVQGDPALKALLEKNDLGQYTEVFDREEVDYNTFFKLTVEHLHGMGVAKLGARMKLLALIEAGPSQRVNPPSTPSSTTSSNSQQNGFGSSIRSEDVKFGECIGNGAYGVVYKGTWHDRPVAIKKLMVSCTEEADLLSRVRHRNVVQCFGVCIDPPNFCLIMELAECNLKQALTTRTVTLPMALDWCLQIAKGMDYLHNGAPRPIIHRDLKPGNILLFPDGTLRITDFGLSRVRDANEGTARMTSVGTFEYMAPEVIKSQPYSEKADVYSYGVVCWEICTRQTPYKGLGPLSVAFGVGSGSLSLTIPDCHPTFQNVLRSCLHMDHRQRPEFPDVLRELKTIEPSAFYINLVVDEQPRHWSTITEAGAASGMLHFEAAKVL